MRDGAMVVVVLSEYLRMMEFPEMRLYLHLPDVYVYRIVLYKYVCGCIFSLN